MHPTGSWLKEHLIEMLPSSLLGKALGKTWTGKNNWWITKETNLFICSKDYTWNDHYVYSLQVQFSIICLHPGNHFSHHCSGLKHALQNSACQLFLYIAFCSKSCTCAGLSQDMFSSSLITVFGQKKLYMFKITAVKLPSLIFSQTASPSAIPFIPTPDYPLQNLSHTQD